MDYIVYAALDGRSYQNAWLGDSDGTVNGTGPKIQLPSSYTDPRLNSFRNSRGFPAIELCNRFGAPGTVGSGANYVLPVPITGTLPAGKTNLDTDIANPYATVSYAGLLYVVQFDTDTVLAVDMCDWNIFWFGDSGEDPAYTFTGTSAQNCGVDLELVVDGYDAFGNPIYSFYGLFACGNSFSGPWQNSYVVRLSIDDSNANRGRLNEVSRVAVGKNATNMIQIRGYTPNGTQTPKNYLLVSSIGGVQQTGQGNGADSGISVLELGPNFAKIADAVDGTYALPSSTLMLDLKAIAGTPTVANDAYIYVIASTYTAGFAGTNFQAAQAKASDIIERAIAIQGGSTVGPLNLGDTQFIGFNSGSNIAGYFWTVAYINDGAGFVGKLVVGRGNSTGDQLLVYQVTPSGIDDSTVVTLDSVTLYNASGCVLNSMTTPSVSGFYMKDGHKTKTHVATPPHEVQTGKISAAEALAIGRGETTK